MVWVIPALLTAFANVARDIFIKKNCKESSHVIVACTRLTAFVVLLAMLPLHKQEIKTGIIHTGAYILWMAVTVILTMVATVLKVRVIQKESISLTQPLMTLTPVFILPWAFLLLKETIDVFALLGILISVSGAFLVVFADTNEGGTKRIRIGKEKRKSLIFLCINLLIVGLTTNIDKIEIGYSSAYLYTLIWTFCSAVTGLYSIFVVGRKEFFGFLFSYKNLVQAVFWTLGFYLQQVAVDWSMDISMNTAYIKSISYVSIILSVLFGGRFFREKGLKKKLLGTAIIISGNLMLIFHSIL